MTAEMVAVDQGQPGDQSHHVADLRSEIAGVEAHMGRVDSKAALLLGLTGAAATAGPVLVSGAHLPAPAAVAAWVAIVSMALAAAMLLQATRPALGRRRARTHGFVAYAEAGPGQVLAELAVMQTVEGLEWRLRDLSRWLLAKYLRIRLAVDIALVGIGCALLAGLLTLV